MASPDRRSDDGRERRSIIALLITVFTTATAAMAQDTVLGKQIFDLTGSNFALGMLGLVAFLPSALLVLVTGSVADRVDRRRVTSVGALGEAAASGALAWYAHTDPTSTLPIYGFVLLFGIARAFTGPASRALPADIVPSDRLPKLVARYAVSWQVALIFGPVLGGFLYAANVSLPYLAVMVLLVIGAIAVCFVQVLPQPARAPEFEPEPAPLPVGTEAVLEAAIEPATGHTEQATARRERAGLHEALEGLRFIRRRPVLLGAISLDLFAVLFGGAVALLPAIATDKLGVGAVGLGWLRAAGGMGAAAVALTLAFRPITRKVGRTLLIVVALFGVFTIVLGVTHSFAVAFIAMAVLSGADAVSVFIRSTLVPLVTPQDKRGRVMAVEMVFIGASNELGAFESGVAGALIGTTGAVVLGGVGTLAVAVSWGFLFPQLRNVDTFPEA
jgi:MFS family permease